MIPTSLGYSTWRSIKLPLQCEMEPKNRTLFSVCLGPPKHWRSFTASVCTFSLNIRHCGAQSHDKQASMSENQMCECSQDTEMASAIFLWNCKKYFAIHSQYLVRFNSELCDLLSVTYPYNHREVTDKFALTPCYLVTVPKSEESWTIWP